MPFYRSLAHAFVIIVLVAASACVADTSPNDPTAASALGDPGGKADEPERDEKRVSTVYDQFPITFDGRIGTGRDAAGCTLDIARDDGRPRSEPPRNVVTFTIWGQDGRVDHRFVIPDGNFHADGYQGEMSRTYSSDGTIINERTWTFWFDHADTLWINQTREPGPGASHASGPPRTTLSIEMTEDRSELIEVRLTTGPLGPFGETTVTCVDVAPSGDL